MNIREEIDAVETLKHRMSGLWLAIAGCRDGEGAEEQDLNAFLAILETAQEKACQLVTMLEERHTSEP